jgi:hypothetical protein
MTFDINKIDSSYYTVKTLQELFPDVEMVLSFPSGVFTYSGIKITNNYTLPSEEELLEKIKEVYERDVIRLQETEYQRQREKSYPKKEDLVIALWEMLVEGRTEQADRLQELRQAVKEQFPKPE